MITINMDKAKDIHKNKLRAEREPMLKDLDVKFQRAQEDGLDTKDIVAKKQALRDVTKHPKLLNAETIEELAVLTLELLI